MKCMKVATKEIDASDYKEFFQTCVQPFEDKPDVKCTFTIISYKLDFFVPRCMLMYDFCIIEPPLLYVGFRFLSTVS